MTTKDDINIQRIYEDSKHQSYDILLPENQDKIYSDTFLEEVIANQILYDHGILSEEFNIIAKNKIVDNAHKDIYEIRVHHFKFISEITYHLNKDYEDQLKKKISASEYYKIDIKTELSEIRNVLLNNPNNYTVVVDFRDNMGNINITGKVGHYSHEVLTGIKQSFFDSFFNEQHYGKMSLLIMMIDKRESKRLSIYSKLVDKYLTDMNKQFIDTKSDNKFDILYRYKG